MRERLVLLVEDDPSDVRLIQRAFNKLQTDVLMIRLTNGDDAVAYLAGQGPYENRVAYPLPGLLLLDIKLPRRSGFEVLDWIRKQQTPLRRLPVIMLTSSTHSADVNRAYDLGVNSYLAKPGTLAGLDDLASQFEKYWLSLNQPPELHGGIAVSAR
ncbi:MAG TPA: response regulator [Terriglobales bacterium]|nr:response regulator [Terriglobales bacterium]